MPRSDEINWIYNCLRMLLVLIAIGCSAGYSQAQDASGVAKSPAPPWVTDLDIPEPLPERIEQVANGTYYLLVSRQIRFKQQERIRYKRFAMKITNREGLEAAGNVSIEYRPEHDKIEVHSIRVHRDGTVLDLLDSTKFHVFRREKDLENGILDGTMTAYANLPSVRIGDVVEYSYSTIYQSILMPTDYFGQFATNFGSPVGVIENRITVPDTMNLDIRQPAQTVEISITKAPGVRVYSWIQRDPEPVTYENNVPSWHDDRDTVEVSSIPSWSATSLM